jgi:hypothetical protein
MIKQHIIIANFYFLLTLLMVHFSTCCFSQDSTSKEKFLVIESTKFRGWQTPPARVKINTGDKVTIGYNNAIITGKIDSVEDSSIVLNGRQIKLNEINRINAVTNRGTNETIIGLSTLAFSVLMISLSDVVYPEKINEEGEDENRYPNTYYCMFFALNAFAGGVLTIVGVIELISIKHYNIGENWKLYVSSTK